MTPKTVPSRSRYGRCPGCRRQVLRLHHTVTGRLGLLETGPHREGRFRVHWQDDGRVLTGTYSTVLDPGPDDAGELYRSHFASCPVDRPKPPRPPGPDDDPGSGEEERCCHACGFRLADDLFRDDMPDLFSRFHPLCVPDELLHELHGWSLEAPPAPAGRRSP